MYRTGSSSRVFDEFFSSTTKPTSQTVDSDQELQQQQQQQLLPIYNPESPLAKKDKSRLRSAETAVHFIPLLLIICAAILWFCSAPGAIPVLSEVMIAARGATDAFSGVHRHVNNSLRKVGAKHIEAGIGCGVGFGHGFGVGLAVKPAVLRQIQSKFSQLAAQLMEKLGIGSISTLSAEQANLPKFLQKGTSMANTPSHDNPAGNISQLVKTLSNSAFNGNIKDGKSIISSEGTVAPKTSTLNTQHCSRTEDIVSNFVQNPLLNEEKGSHHEQAGALQLDNNVLQMVLKHQILIEELMQENEKLRQILVEELKVEPSKFQSNFTSRNKSSCTDCFECRRKQRKR